MLHRQFVDACVRSERARAELAPRISFIVDIIHSVNDFAAQIAKPPVGPSFLLSQVGAHAALTFGGLLATIDLKPHHAGILRMLGSNPGLTQQALSRLLGVLPSQLVFLLDALEARRLIERRDDADDRRRYSLYLSPRGRKTLQQIGRLTLKLEKDLFSTLRPAELQLLQSLLARIVVQQRITPGVHPAYKQLNGQNLTQEAKVQTFTTKIQEGEKKDVTGIVVPHKIVEALGKGKKPAVKVTVNGHAYRSTVASMDGHFMISLSREHREAAGVEGGDEVTVRLELDAEPRMTQIPHDLKAALTKARSLDKFEKLAPSRKKEFVRQVEEAKAQETRQRRILKIVGELS